MRFCDGSGPVGVSEAGCDPLNVARRRHRGLQPFRANSTDRGNNDFMQESPLKTGQNRRRSTALALALCCLAPAGLAAGPDRTVPSVLVKLQMTLGTASWTGDGIYLGRGLVLTAHHLTHPVLLTHPTVAIADLILPAELRKQGDGVVVDLTLLQIDPQRLPAALQGHVVSLCPDAPHPGQTVITVSGLGIVHSNILDPELLPRGTPPQFLTVIREVEGAGNSGSGVFDEETNCLLGIITRRIDRVETSQLKDGQLERVREPVAKYFEPASKIRNFLPQETLAGP
jgi:hypothetical protein